MDTNFKGTKTPWVLRDARKEHGLLFVESSKENLGTPYGQEILAEDYFKKHEKFYDAVLISTAPELLEVLKEVVVSYEWKKDDENTPWDKADDEHLEKCINIINKALNIK